MPLNDSLNEAVNQLKLAQVNLRTAAAELLSDQTVDVQKSTQLTNMSNNAGNQAREIENWIKANPPKA